MASARKRFVIEGSKAATCIPQQALRSLPFAFTARPAFRPAGGPMHGIVTVSANVMKPAAGTPGIRRRSTKAEAIPARESVGRGPRKCPQTEPIPQLASGPHRFRGNGRCCPTGTHSERFRHAESSRLDHRHHFFDRLAGRHRRVRFHLLKDAASRRAISSHAVLPQ